MSKADLDPAITILHRIIDAGHDKTDEDARLERKSIKRALKILYKAEAKEMSKLGQGETK